MALNSGTAALRLALALCGVGAGDEVITVAQTCTATNTPILEQFATPVFADIASLDELTVSPDDIEARIDERTKGIVAVHYAGFPCNMDGIVEIARSHNLFVIEDVAHAVGAEYSLKLKAQNSSQNNGQRTTESGRPQNWVQSMTLVALASFPTRT